MDELFKKIFESEVLTEENKTELKEAFNSALNEAIEQTKAQTEIDVKADLAEQYINDKNALIEALDTKVEDYLKEHFEELHEDVTRFRDLEVEYAQKLVEAKGELAESLRADMSQLIDDLDDFFELRLDEEITELREGIEAARKNQFGTKIFEAFAQEYGYKFREEDTTFAELEESKVELNSVKKRLVETSRELSKIRRENEIARVLEPLSGKSREVMEAIIATVPTNKIEETYRNYIGRVLHENAIKVEDAEKETGDPQVLAEGNDSTINKSRNAMLTTGDNESLIENVKEIDAHAQLSEAAVEKLKKLAGIV